MLRRFTHTLTLITLIKGRRYTSNWTPFINR